MNVTTINQLVSVSILLERDEAIAALKDPSELQRQLREALGDLAPVTLGVCRNGHRKAAPKSKVRRAMDKLLTRKLPKLRTCPHCGEERKGQGFYRHEASCKIKHANAAPAASD